MAKQAVGTAADDPVHLWTRAAHQTWRLVGATVGGALRYRVTGLAAEAAFFAILSLPPLVVALAASIGFFAAQFPETRVNSLRDEIIARAGQVLTDDSVNTVIAPTLSDVLKGGRVDVLSIGFVLALWSGSRALNVFVDTITIMYGLGGQRGIIKTRVLSFTLYLIGLVLGAVVLPLVVIGPEIVDELMPEQVSFLSSLYWPVVSVLSIAFLTSLYHLSVPVRTSWWRDIPGAAFALGMWILSSYLLRWTLQSFVDPGQSMSIYGPLAAPIVVLLWLYLTALAVLIGASLNAGFDRVWPASETASARLELVRRLRRAARLDRLRGASTDEELVDLERLEKSGDAATNGENGNDQETVVRPIRER
ncbi:MAG: YihY/virulence factor BrkB family protein [Propionibacteriales bacterium]|nr:YihY/virulence factor BrkB family protein [Propionibacteriales bacterium]